MSKTVEDIGTLKINLLTQAQYDAEKAGGRLEDDELYLTPSSGGGGGAFYAEYGETTYQEIVEALGNGSTVICTYYDDDMDDYFEIPLLTADETGGYAVFYYTFALPQLGTIKVYSLEITSSDEWNDYITSVSLGGGEDYVVAKGVSNNWEYREWDSARYECWRKCTLAELPILTQVGNLYCGGFSVNLPNKLFSGTPNVVATVTYCDSSTALLFPTINEITSTTISGYICSATAITEATVKVDLYAYGNTRK